MSDHQQANLQDLVRDYRGRSSARKAIRLLNAVRREAVADDFDLAVLLRDHEKYPVYEELEIEQRDAFDELLNFYSLLEIACRIGYVPPMLTTELKDEVLTDLYDRDLRRYYEIHYPLFLPQSLRDRLIGKQARSASYNAGAIWIFTAFLDLNRALTRKTIEAFLSMLDGFADEDDNDLTDVMAVLRSPDRIIACLSRSTRLQTPLDRAVVGFSELVWFCQELDDLLRNARRFAPLQAGIWHYHAYWFAQAKSGWISHLQRAISNVVEAGSGGGITVSPVGVRKLEASLRRLAGGGYRGVTVADRAFWTRGRETVVAERFTADAEPKVRRRSKPRHHASEPATHDRAPKKKVGTQLGANKQS